jgi:hypothetical protein
MVTELRPLNANTEKTGELVLRGTPEKLLERLVYDDTSAILDPTFIQDFLLTYRVFIDKPQFITAKLHEWFEKLPSAAVTNGGNNASPQSLTRDLQNLALKKKIYRIVLEWITNHYNDFETNRELYAFLERFQEILNREKMPEQFKVLTIAISTKSRARTVTLARSKREEQLQFNIQGGWDKGYGVFVSRVDRESKAYELGMRRADQILDVNGHSFTHITLASAIEILKSFTHTSITLKYNPIAFNEMLLHPDKSPYRNKKTAVLSSANMSLPNGGAAAAGNATVNANKAVLAEYIQNQYQPPGLINHLTNDAQHVNMLKKTIGSMPPAATVQSQASTQSLTSLNITPTQPKMQQQPSVKDNRFNFRLLNNNNPVPSTVTNNNNNNSSQIKKILGRFNKKAHSKDLESHVDLSVPSLKSITRSPSPSMLTGSTLAIPAATSLMHTSTSTLSFSNNSNSHLTRNNSSHNMSTSTSNGSFGAGGNHSAVNGNGAEAVTGQFDTSLTKLNLQDQQQFVGEHVLKIYKNDQIFKYLVVHKVVKLLNFFFN